MPNPILRTILSPMEIEEITLYREEMDSTSILKNEFLGRNGLSRTLESRFTQNSMFYFFSMMTIIFGFLVVVNVLAPLLGGHFRSALSFSGFIQLLFFAFSAYMAWVIRETSPLRLHLHGERLIYELRDKTTVTFTFTEIQRIRFKHHRGVFGFYLDLQSGTSHHFPINLERLDYILDSIHFHRSDLTMTPEFMRFREKALVVDHVLAHNTSYLSRARIKALPFYFIYPFFIAHILKRIKADPQQVRRDIGYEKKLETLCHKVNICISLATLVIVVFMKL